MYTEVPLFDVLNYLPDGIIIVDERGVILFANESFSEMLGYENTMLTGLNILTILADIDVFQKCISKVMRDGKSLDASTDFLHHDGHIVETTKSVRMISHNGTTRFFVNIRNQSEVNLLNKELLLSKELIEFQAHELSKLLA
jgi:PAS domain S-box-containing protein